jgi:hypothetical protein
MSQQVKVIGYTGTDSPEYQKHFKAVHFCITNDLSFPIETSEFFKGKINGDSLEDFKKEALLNQIRYGFEVKIPQNCNKTLGEIWINTKDIPSTVTEICVKIV